MRSAHKLWMCQRSRMAALIRQLTRLCPGSSGLVKPVNIKKSSAYHKGGNVRVGRRMSTHTHTERSSTRALQQRWAGRVWLWAWFSNSKTQSYPKVIFLSLDHVEQAPVCQAKQYVATRHLIQTHLQRESPGWLTQPGWGCRPWSPRPRELGSALGAVLEYKLESYMKFACLKYHSLW